LSVSLRSLLVVAALALLAGCGGADGPGAGWSDKVDARVLADTDHSGTGHFIVVLRDQADAADAARETMGRDAQGLAVVDTLRASALSQQPIRAELQRRGAPFRSFWIVNAVATHGSRGLVRALAEREDVLRVEPDRSFPGATLESGHAVSAAPRGVEWNVKKIGAPEVWAAGFTGQGMVYANADTGVQWEAPALKSHYRGWNGTTAAHDYNWWDAVHADIDGNGSNSCGFSTQAPCDDDVQGVSHGTHTMGTAVGDDGAGNQIGVAPGAKWISCRNMDEGLGRPSTYIECLQFFLAPTDLRGQDPDPTRRPNAVGNSYACPPEEQCTVGSLRAAVDNLRAAGVFVAVSAGNEGRGGCSTVSDPPAVYDSSVTVGATDTFDGLACFSSRGPVLADGSPRTKPDLVAPGVGVRSASRVGYVSVSGTSMASPHVAAAAVLLWSAFPALVGNVDATEVLMELSAVPMTTREGCGGDGASTIPNNAFGYGRLDVAAAYKAQSGQGVAPVASIASVSVTEGNSGRKAVKLAVTLSKASAAVVSVRYATRNGTARAPADYAATTGLLSFPAGKRTGSVTVRIVGDAVFEPSESFTVRLSAPKGLRLGRATGTVTIRNDDKRRS
jgi:subtilisin family serine protease